jgi:hypothetical protein
MVSVDVPEPFATELGLNEHVGAGVPPPVMPLQAKLTVPLKPLVGAMVIVEVADPPAETEAGESAEAAIVKSAGGGVTVRLTVVSWLNDPEVPVTVTLEVAVGVVAEVAIVRVEVTGANPGVTDGGTNEQLAPDGRPAGHVRVTALLKPFAAVTIMVDALDCPAITEKLAGAALKLKSVSNPYTSNWLENVARYTFPFAIVGGENLA